MLRNVQTTDLNRHLQHDKKNEQRTSVVKPQMKSKFLLNKLIGDAFDYYNFMEPLKWNPENNGKQNLVKIKL